MYFVDSQGSIQDDGRGMETPAYGIDARGARRELDPRRAEALTRAFHTAAIQSITCERCRNFAYHGLQHRPVIKDGGYHHPSCPLVRPPSRLPLGDYVARATSAAGIQPCPPCKQRQAELNALGERLMGFLGR